MVKISLRPTFIKEVFLLFKERPLKEILFGKKVSLGDEGEELLKWITRHGKEFKEKGGRRGTFALISFAHRASGRVYLLPRTTGDANKESILLFGKEFSVIPGPDLWVYLSTSNDVRKDLGNYMNLGLIKGTKGGQLYVVQKPITELENYKSVVIYCKQFSVLFSFAMLH